MIDTEKKKKKLVQCCDLEQRRVVPPLHEGHTELNSNRMDWLDSRDEQSR